jgi:hypothetical protein
MVAASARSRVLRFGRWMYAGARRMEVEVRCAADEVGKQCVGLGSLGKSEGSCV